MHRHARQHLAGRRGPQRPHPATAAGAALAALVERATNGTPLDGITGANNTETVNRLFSDNVHLTNLGMYYMALVTYASVYERSPVGAAAPSGISAAQARSLQETAWAFVSNFYSSYRAPDLASCRATVATSFCSTLLDLPQPGKRCASCTATFSAQNSNNPLYYSAGQPTLRTGTPHLERRSLSSATPPTPHPAELRMFEGFTAQSYAVNNSAVYAVVGGPADAPPLLLLHGYPQTHAMWHRVAQRLATRYRLVIPDLRGYGRSARPPVDDDHAAHSKRAMAADAMALMQHLGHDRFFVAGHDRGGRVGHRLALDHPQAWPSCA